MRGEAEEAGPFVERFLDEAEFAEFEVAEAAMDEAGGIGGRSEGEIGRIDEPDADAVEYEFARGGGTVDSATEDDYRFFRHYSSKNVRPQYAGGGQFEQYDASSLAKLDLPVWNAALITRGASDPLSENEFDMAAENEEDQLIQRALAAARDTKVLVVRGGVRHDAAKVFAQHFGNAQALIVADENTYRAAGVDVSNAFAWDLAPGCPAFVFGPSVYADEQHANELTSVLSSTDAVPVAVGSGTINDLTKLAAHRVNRPYMVVATAASMDGYTAYGASITAQGSKQTFDCPAPKVVLADFETIAGAPEGMNASGYADLIAKVAAGADWIVADALGVEEIEPDVWNTVQLHLREWVDSPTAVAGREPEALKRLTNGLMMTGFAMQAHQTSRPASGADHQFSHLWDMQHHAHEGVAPSHGFKVGIGTVASLALYEELLSRDLAKLDVDDAVSRWPSLEQLNSQIGQLLGDGELGETAIKETAAKYVGRDALRTQLERLREVWPQLRQKLRQQAIPVVRLKQMLRDAGCPCEPEQIGISADRLRRSYWQALFIRRRFTVLDLAHRTGLLDAALTKLFGPGGCWARSGA